MRVIVYDRTCTGRVFGLTHSWIAGGVLYRGLRRVDHVIGVGSWAEALTSLAALPAIDEIQYWGHGKWGAVRVDRDVLDGRALLHEHALYAPLNAVKARLRPNALWWFRTCETFGAEPGHRFASDFAEHMGARVAGHTFIIGPWQSGLHALSPGQRPDWDRTEGLKEGSVHAPKEALWSGPSRPNTIHCLNGRIPARYWVDSTD